MQITINQSDLAKNLSIVTRALPNKSILTILENILIDFDRVNSAIICTATDLSMHIKAVIPAQFGLIDDCQGLKQICVSGKQFKDIIGSLPSSNPVELTLKFKNDTAGTDDLSGLNIQSGKAKFNIPVISATEFPIVPEPSGDSFILPADDFKQAIKQTIFATTQDDPRPFIAVICMDLEPGGIKIVATDQNRLVTYQLSCDTKLSKRSLIPAALIKKILDVFDNGTNIQFYSTDTKLFIVSNSGKVITGLSLVNASYPQYQQIFKMFETTLGVLSINADTFAKTLGRVKLINDRVILRVHPGNATMDISCTCDRGDFQEDISIKEIRADSEFYNMFHVGYLLDFLKNTEAETIDCQYLVTDRAAQFIEHDDSGRNVCQYVVMPMKMGAQ